MFNKNTPNGCITFKTGKILSIFNALKMTEHLREFDDLKESGYSAKLVLLLLLVIIAKAHPICVFLVICYLPASCIERQNVG